jgi:CubicO group peptidase (beta-lactamase class C family)
MRRLAIRLLASIAFACLSPSPSHAQAARAVRAKSAPDLKAFDAYVAKAVKDWEVPGFAIAIVKDDSVVFARGYGVRELGKAAPVNEHTLFAIGSTTKAMTAAALGMLVDEKKVEWDAPAKRYIPALELQDPVMTREITVRDLLTHHTGLPGADLLWSGSDYSIDEIVRRVRFVKPFASFRSRYAYMNVQYALAGEVLRSAGGVPWDAFVRTRIFEPLGMRETVPTLKDALGRPNIASPHMRIDDTIRVVENRAVDPVAPAGAVWSSVSDMARWMRFVLDSGHLGSKRLISEQTFRELLTPQVVVPAESFYPTTQLTRPHFTNYGLGWFLEDYNGNAVAMHTGSIDGMIAIIGLIPDQRLGVYVLANLDHAELRHALMFRAFDLYTAGPGRDWSTEMRALYGKIAERGRAAEKEIVSKRVSGTHPSHALEKYVGAYADSLVGVARITLERDSLRVRIGKAFSGTLEHWHFDTFRVRWDDKRAGWSLVTFVLDAMGNVRAVRAELDGAIEFGRVGGED